MKANLKLGAIFICLAFFISGCAQINKSNYQAIKINAPENLSSTTIEDKKDTINQKEKTKNEIPVSVVITDKKTSPKKSSAATENKIKPTPAIVKKNTSYAFGANSGRESLNSLTKIYYPVVKVVDGDTIDVMIDGKKERLRLIGINTPETVDPRKPVQCFGLEASAQAHQWLDGQDVELEADPTQDDRDKYGRLLRYVRRRDGSFYNLEIIKAGYAYEYTYIIPYQYQTEFKAAEKNARENKLGLWSENTCNGKF
jgi:micrococcal nuclease